MFISNDNKMYVSDNKKRIQFWNTVPFNNQLPNKTFGQNIINGELTYDI